MKHITSVTNAMAVDAGEAICFDIVTDDGATTFSVPRADLARLVLFFTGAAQALNDGATDSESDDYVFPIPLTGLDLRQGATPQTNVLALNVSGYWLGFEVDTRLLVSELRSAIKLATTLAMPDNSQIN